MTLAIRSRVFGIGRSIKRDNPRPHYGGNVHRTGVTADHEVEQAGKGGKLEDSQRTREAEWRVDALLPDLLNGASIRVGSQQQHMCLLTKRISETGEVLNRPATLGHTCARVDADDRLAIGERKLGEGLARGFMVLVLDGEVRTVITGVAAHHLQKFAAVIPQFMNLSPIRHVTAEHLLVLHAAPDAEPERNAAELGVKDVGVRVVEDHCEVKSGLAQSANLEGLAKCALVGRTKPKFVDTGKVLQNRSRPFPDLDYDLRIGKILTQTSDGGRRVDDVADVLTTRDENPVTWGNAEHPLNSGGGFWTHPYEIRSRELLRHTR